MKTTHFDPFRNRLARDIRNSLAQAFIGALVNNESSLFRTKVSAFLKQNLEQVFKDYVKNRLQHYEELFSFILDHSATEGLQQAELFREHKLYFSSSLQVFIPNGRYTGQCPSEAVASGMIPMMPHQL